MARLFVDNREIEAPLDFSSLSEVIKHVEAAYLSPDSVVRTVRIDGLPLDPAAQGKPDFLQGIGPREKIEIFTGTFAEIARESIEDALAYLNRVEAATPSLISSFQTSPGPECFENLKQLYEGLYWMNLLLAKLKSRFQMGFDDTLVKGMPASAHHRKFITVLQQLIQSQQKGDLALMSDLLEYEILPLVPVWRDMFAIVAERVPAAP